jgi:sugar O-acyltransferase (sialic acid O-acetyltransferase NeuD family)
MPQPTLQRLAVYGAGGCGRLVADLAEACGGWRVDLFDDSWPGLHTSGPWPVVGDAQCLEATLDTYAGVVVALGDCARRLSAHRRLRAAGARLPVLVHPKAWVSPHAELSAGCIVMAGAVVNVGAALGQACMINTGATVSHDCALGDGVHISPGANLAGTVTVGESTWVGLGAAVKHGVHLGRDAIVGAGAVVIRHVFDGTCVVGCPARLLWPAREGNPKL